MTPCNLMLLAWVFLVTEERREKKKLGSCSEEIYMKQTLPGSICLAPNDYLVVYFFSAIFMSFSSIFRWLLVRNACIALQMSPEATIYTFVITALVQFLLCTNFHIYCI